TLDKALTKKILAGYGIQSPRGRLVTRETLGGGGLDDLFLPVIVKPNYEGSSKGNTQGTVVEGSFELAATIEEPLAPNPDRVVVGERYVPGVDVAACFVEGIGARIVTPVEYVVDPGYQRPHHVLDYELKHQARGNVSLRTPPALAAITLDRVRSIGERAISAL